MRKFIFVLALIAFISTSSYAQENKRQDLIYLNNGSIIRGQILKQTSKKTLKIKTKNGKVLVYKMKDVAKIRKSESQQQKRKAPKVSSKNGYFGAVKLSYAIGVGKKEVDFDGNKKVLEGAGRIFLNVINGFKFNPHVSLGIGVGVVHFPKISVTTIPISLYFRGNLTNTKFVPYVGLSLGYSISLGGNKDELTNETYNAGGVICEPIIGVAYSFAQKYELTLGVGYSVMSAEYSYTENITYEYPTGAVAVKLGFTF